MKSFTVHGLIPAVFTPMKEDGSLNLAQIAPLVDHLVNHHAAALFISGSAGEGISLTIEERKQITEETVRAAAGRIPVIVQVGHASLAESRYLASHAQRKGADAISAILPSYFKPATLDLLIGSLQEIVRGAPDMPFYYYHIPYLVDLSLNTMELLDRAESDLPSMVGIKYSTPNVFEITTLKTHFGSRYNLLFGVDEMLLSGLVAGADGAVGSTYNFLLPICNNIVDAYQRGDLMTAMTQQALATEFIRIVNSNGGLAAIKATMQFLGLDCGPVRLPLVQLALPRVLKLKQDLTEAGFFNFVQGAN